MPLDIRYAGLESDVERRVRFATNGLAAHEVHARASAWDGTRCDLLVTDTEDAYGRVAIDLARRRDTPILAFTNDIERADTWAGWLRRDATVATLTKALLDVIAERTQANEQPANAVRMQASPPSRASLVRLALEPGLSGANAMLSVRDRRLYADLDGGRMHAASHSDILHARDMLAGSDWSLSPAGGSQRPARMEHASSLDSIYLDAALHRGGALPEFPLTQVWLCDWPDLGQVPEHIEALLVVRMLLRGKTDATAIGEATGIAPVTVNACLWAFAAAGLLHHASLSGHQPSPVRALVKGRFSQLVARVARHFGLGEQLR